MPLPGKRWRHIILNTHCSWLHGDERGFRSRGHRIHSSGDYRNPPPEEEHAGLRDYHKKRSAKPSFIAREAFKIVGLAVLENLRSKQHRVVAVSVNTSHVHAVVELPDNVSRIRTICGWCKFFGTRALRRSYPSYRTRVLWAKGETYEPVDTRGHLDAAHNYVLLKQGKDAWTWSYERGAKW